MKHWITINEPLQTAVNGYGIGHFAPGGCEGQTSRCYLAAHHQILAHAAAVDVYRRKFKVCLCFYLNYRCQGSVYHFQGENPDPGKYGLKPADYWPVYSTHFSGQLYFFSLFFPLHIPKLIFTLGNVANKSKPH